MEPISRSLYQTVKDDVLPLAVSISEALDGAEEAERKRKYAWETKGIWDRVIAMLAKDPDTRLGSARARVLKLQKELKESKIGGITVPEATDQSLTFALLEKARKELDELIQKVKEDTARERGYDNAKQVERDLK